MSVKRNFIGVKVDQTREFLLDKDGKPIYVGSIVLNPAGYKRRVLALNRSTTSTTYGALLLQPFEDPNDEVWGEAKEYTVEKS
jgi:hypothetical protein